MTMTSVESLTDSERFARSLLAAWNSGDLPRLRLELKQIAAADYSAMSPFEHEKFEIVQGVAQTMRVWLGGAKRKHADLNIALTLLRHLIGQEAGQDLGLEIAQNVHQAKRSLSQTSARPSVH